MKIEWIEGEPEIDSVCYRAIHNKRAIDIVHDSCRGTTTLVIEERDKDRGGLGQKWDRFSTVSFETSVGSNFDVEQLLKIAQALCDEQDRLDTEPE
jgi:hypothetical protein